MAPDPFRSDLFPDAPALDPVRRLRSAVVKIRSLRGQVGHDGLTPSAARTLLDEVTAALDACATALEELRGTEREDPTGGGSREEAP